MKRLLAICTLLITVTSWGQCDPYTLPFTEGFEGTTFPPACWDSFIGTNGLGTIQNWKRRTVATYNNSAGVAYVQNENVNGGLAEDWLVTPAIELPSTTNEIQLKFQEDQIYNIPDYGTRYYIKIATSNPTDHASYTDVIDYGESDFGNPYSYSQRTIDLSAYAGQTIYIAFVMEQDNADGWYIDNVSIKENIPPSPPIAIDATNITPTKFRAYWNTAANTTNYRLDVSTASDFSTYVSGYENLNVGNLTNYNVTGLAQDTEYYYRVRAVSEFGTSDNSNSITVTTGIENIWNGSVWSAGSAPTSIDTAIIEGDYDTSTEGTFSAYSLTVNSGGSMIIASGDNITVANAVVNNTDATAFIIQDNANLIQENDVANTGEITVQKNSSPLYRLDYTMWSSPVSGQNLQEFSPQTLSNRFYTYNETTDFYNTVDPSATEFDAGLGYLIRMPNNHPDYVDTETPGTQWTGSFVGTPNNGDVTVSLSTTLNGYNLVGNPYPSPINISDFYTANSGTISSGSALYFWRKRNAPSSSSYATVTLAAYIANNQEGGFGDTGSDTFVGDPSFWVINQGQGFIIQATGNNLVFNNNMRRAINNGQFFRMNQQGGIDISRLWLNIKGTNGEFNQMAIAYSNATTNSIDYGWDGKMLENNDVVKLYSIEEDTKFSIQAREAFADTDIVALGYKAKNAGSYTISLDRVDGFFEEGQKIYLNDKLLSITHSLTEGDYNFSSTEGTFNDRFEIIYSINALDTNTPVVNANQVVVYKNGNSIMIDAGTAEMNTINVYDVNGRLLYKANDINATTTAVNLNAAKQIILLEIITDKGTVNKKFVL